MSFWICSDGYGGGGFEDNRTDILEEECVAVPIPLKRTPRRIEGVVSGDNMDVVSRCLIGRCRFPISNIDLAEALPLEKRVVERDLLSNWFDRVVNWNKVESAMVNHRVWISDFGVLIHAWSSDTFERLVAHWGSMIHVVEETMKQSSFERGRVLSETTSLDQIEECLELRLPSGKKTRVSSFNFKSLEFDSREMELKEFLVGRLKKGL
ncbi:hypothetical protein V6N11_051453 [Hibiscus sabdariffa]|uniref:DUF4283 domain-containing protein n=1 Tax=Hibiscus sabdariffa TaxID=183260 RepID=A0ABR2U752_9ROSI